MTGPQNGIGRRNGLGTAALILAIVGLALCWSVAGGIVAGVAALILGLLGRGRVARGEADNGGVAVAGIALGLLAVVVSLVFVVIWVFAWRDTGGSDYLDCVVQAGNDRQAADVCMNKWLNNVENQFSVTVTTPVPGSA